MSKLYIQVFFGCGLILNACGGQGDTSDLSREDQIKKKQYMVFGRDLYVAHCSNCHGQEGKGLGRLYPPLNPSDFMEENFELSVCIIKNGAVDPIVVNDIEYVQPMPAFPNLTDLEIAEITTYIYNTWTDRDILITPQEIRKILDDCKP